MYLAMRKLIPTMGEGALRNATVESAVLHARNLCNLFCSHTLPGDIVLTSILDPRKVPFPGVIENCASPVKEQTK